MSVVAMSIDSLLPGLPAIGRSFDVEDPTKNQLLITMIFLGLGFGQLIFGPLSDSFGRKPIVYFGFGVFILASIICVSTTSFEWMIFGRILQGIGLACPRTMSISMVRDTYSGDLMAKVLSIIAAFFILIPVIAPTLGQWILDVSGWRAIFNFNLLLCIVIMLWFWRGQEETLKNEYKIKFNLKLFYNGAIEFVQHKRAVCFTLISGFITGSFMVYLSTSQQIFQEQYGLGKWFPYIFGLTAIAVGSATFTNSQLVMRFGSYKISKIATFVYAIISLVYVVLFYNGNNPDVFILISFFVVQFFAIGLLFGNLRALAMEPLGHIAGIGAAINGFVSTIMAVPIANYIGSFVSTSTLPLFIGFTFFGSLSVVTFLILDRLERNKLDL